MTPDTVRELIPLYVMGELEGGDAAALEALLVRSPDLRAEARACTETFAAIAEAASAPPAALPAQWPGIESRLRPRIAFDSSLADNGHASRTPEEERPVPDGRAWQAWCWPAAAAVLLLLNLLQFWWRSVPARGEHDSAASHMAAPDARPRSAHVDAIRSGEGGGPAGAAASTLAPGDARSAGEAAPMAAAMEALDRAWAEKYEQLAEDYAELAELVVPLFGSTEAAQRASGPWTMELRSALQAEAHAASGLWDRVRELVPESGVALLPDRWRLAGELLLDGQTGFRNDDGAAGGWGVNAGAGAPPSDAAPPPAPFATALLNGEQGLGYLDLYNLPDVPDGHELTLWIQSQEGGAYTPVGAVPPVLGGGSGALVFRVPEVEAQPARIVITLEATSPAGPSPQPTGPVIIESP